MIGRQKRCYVCGKLFESESLGIQPCSKCMEYPLISAIEQVNTKIRDDGWDSTEGRAMNVDEAMAKWKELREQYDWAKYSPTLTDIFVAEVERLRAELAKLQKDWCDDDEAIKQQALRVLPAEWVEGDSVHVPRGPELAERMADKFLDLARECLNTDADCERLLAELAAAKAASVVPVEEVQTAFDKWLEYECWECHRSICEATWKAAIKWMKERGEG